MTVNTSIERVDTLIVRSDRIYDAIDPLFDGEPRYRRMLRNGVITLATALRNGEEVGTAGLRLARMGNVQASRQHPLSSIANTYGDITRATKDRQDSPETDARHAIHLMKMAVPYAQEFYPKLNPGKVAAYALLHDIIEAYAGDTPSLGMTPQQEQAKHHSKALALIRLEQEYGQDWPEFIALIQSYEALADSEACFVKTFDKLDPGFTHFYNEGAELKGRYGLLEHDFYGAIDQATERMKPYSGDFDQLMRDRDELTRRVAQVAFKKAA